MPHLHCLPGQLDLTVEVLIVHDQRVLLRRHDKHGIWLSVGGHVELDEDPLQAARREVREEVGLDVVIDDSHMSYHHSEPGYSELVPPVFMCRVRVSDSHEHVTVTYFARSDSDLVQPDGHDRSDDWRWFDRSELDDPRWGLKETVASYAKAALDRLADQGKPSRRRLD